MLKLRVNTSAHHTAFHPWMVLQLLQLWPCQQFAPFHCWAVVMRMDHCLLSVFGQTPQNVFTLGFGAFLTENQALLVWTTLWTLQTLPSYDTVSVVFFYSLCSVWKIVRPFLGASHAVSFWVWLAFLQQSFIWLFVILTQNAVCWDKVLGWNLCFITLIIKKKLTKLTYIYWKCKNLFSWGWFWCTHEKHDNTAHSPSWPQSTWWCDMDPDILSSIWSHVTSKRQSPEPLAVAAC